MHYSLSVYGFRIDAIETGKNILGFYSCKCPPHLRWFRSTQEQILDCLSRSHGTTKPSKALPHTFIILKRSKCTHTRPDVRRAPDVWLLDSLRRCFLRSRLRRVWTLAPNTHTCKHKQGEAPPHHRLRAKKWTKHTKRVHYLKRYLKWSISEKRFRRLRLKRTRHNLGLMGLSFLYRVCASFIILMGGIVGIIRHTHTIKYTKLARDYLLPLYTFFLFKK